jgi:starch phosphorylase
MQLVIAGKAHPQDHEAKDTLRELLALRHQPNVASHIVFLEDYDMHMAPRLVAGVDLWLNLPRPPLEASGTSGMKAALNGGLNVSVLDGWWAEAYDGSNGWGVDGAVEEDVDAQDDRHAAATLELIEKEVVPLFYDCDDDGVPRGWVRRVKASIRTAGLGFTAQRMVGDYARSAYRHEQQGSPASDEA